MPSETQSRTCSVQIRLSAQELAYVEQLAAKDNISLSALLRQRSLHRRLPQKIIDVLPNAYLELAYLGRQIEVGLLQLRQASSRDAAPPKNLTTQLQTTLFELETLLDQIDTQVVTLGLHTHVDEIKEGYST